MVSTREVFGKTLVELGKDKKIVVLSADLASSTKLNYFKEKYPDRFIEMGISEQDIINVAAGLALVGYIPFVSTYSVFGCGRGWEQIRNCICLDNLNVKLVFTHAGLGVGGDGATHQMLEDIAIMRVIPNIKVMTPADDIEIREMIKFIRLDKGPAYVRLYRQDCKRIFSESYKFKINEYPILNEGKELIIFSCGDMVSTAVEIGKKINAAVVNVHTIKPLNRKQILKHVEKYSKIVTIEDHSVLGGLGSAILESISETPIPLLKIGVEDKFGQSCRSNEIDKLYDLYGLSKYKILNKINKWVNKL